MIYGQLFADKLKCSKTITERKKKYSEKKVEHKLNQSQTKRTFQNKIHVNQTKQNKITTPGQSDFSTPKISKLSKEKESEEKDRENLYHWEATKETMDNIRRNNSPETRRLVEQQNALSRPGLLRRRHDHQTQRNKFAPSRLNKRSREEIAETDAELIRRSSRIGGGYHPVEIEGEQEEPEEIQ